MITHISVKCDASLLSGGRIDENKIGNLETEMANQIKEEIENTFQKTQWQYNTDSVGILKMAGFNKKNLIEPKNIELDLVVELEIKRMKY